MYEGLLKRERERKKKQIEGKNEVEERSTNFRCINLYSFQHDTNKHAS